MGSRKDMAGQEYVWTNIYRRQKHEDRPWSNTTIKTTGTDL
jgi:hypothetical protein